MLKRIMLGAALALALQAGSCTNEIAYDGCVGYNKSMPVMTALNRANKLSPAQRQTVTYVRNTLGREICEKDKPPTEADLIQLGLKSMVDGGVAALRKIEAEVK